MTNYLASPYMHEDAKVREQRFLDVTKCAAALMDRGEKIYGPITHGHTINKYMTMPPGDHRFWLAQCYDHVVGADNIYVLGIDGWSDSTGVRWEIETGWAWKIPVYLLDPVTYKKTRIYKNNKWSFSYKLPED